jgi:GT2 family glycosyltransferase
MKTLMIIIPVYNNSKFTKACLEDLVKIRDAGKMDLGVVVVDNASEDDTREVVQNYGLGMSYIRNQENLGFSRANNIGYRFGCPEDDDYIMFMNNDIKVLDRHEDWPEILMEACGDDGIVGVQSGRINSKYDPVGEGKFDPNVKGGYLSGWCMMAKASTWNQLILEGQDGPWNEDYFLYYEDDDLSFRAKKQGIPLRITDIPVQHYSRVTGKKYNMFYFLKKSKRIFKKAWPEIV